MLRSCKQHPSVGCCLSLTAYRSSIGGKRTRFSLNNSNAEKHRSNIICPISDAWTAVRCYLDSAGLFKHYLYSRFFISRVNLLNDGTVWETVIISVKSGIEWGVFERCLSRWWMCVESEFPHSLIWHVKIITTSEKRTNDVACNSWAGAWSEFRNSVPSLLLLFVGTKRREKNDMKRNTNSKL